MKKLYYICCLIIATVMTIGCEDTTPSSNPTIENPTSSSDDQPAAASNELFLLNAIATSSARRDDSWYFLDDNENTIWTSNPGTGSGEYIHLEFLPTKDNFVKSIAVRAESGARLSRVNALAVYVNGELATVAKPNTDIPIGKNLKDLKIYFQAVEDLKTTAREINGAKVTMQQTLPGKKVGITDIYFYGSNGEKLKLRQQQKYNGSIQTGTTLKPADQYRAANLFDGSQANAWVEGTEGDGTGEVIKFDLSSEAPAEKLVMLNGYHRSEEHYKSNARVKAFSIKTENDKPQKFTLRDDMTPQILTFDPPLSGKNYEIEVRSVFKGEKNKDLAISELTFIRADGTAWRVNTTAENASPTDLGSGIDAVLDRFHGCTTQSGEQTTAQYIILRKNGSFDFLSSEDSGHNDVRLWQATGTWQKIANNKLKLSGGWKDLNEDGSFSFSEKVTIKENYLSGEEFFDKIYLK